MKGRIVIIGMAVAVLGTLAQAQIAVQGGGDSPAAPESVVPPPTTSQSNHKDLLEFLNGDVLHGSFLSIDSKKGVHWQHPAMKEPIEVDPSSVARIKLERPAASGGKAGPGQTCRVRLTNRDELFGQLAALDDQKLTLETWYGGTLSIPRKMIDSVAPGQGHADYVFEGPTGMEGWTVRGSPTVVRRGLGGLVIPAAGEGTSWTYTNGAFASSGNGSIGHAFTLPPQVNIEFDLSWRGYLLMAVSLFSDSLDSYGGNSYLLQFNQNNAYLQRISNMGNSMPFPNANVTTFAQQNKAHVSLRADKQKKTVYLVVDGIMVKEWTDTAQFPNGSNLVFHQQGQGFSKISGLKITAWDGKFEGPEGSEKKTKEDFVKLVNGDKISGSLKNIQNGKMSFQTAFAPLEVPLERIAQIELAGENSEKAPKQPGDVKLTFLDHGSISLHLEQWDGQQIIGTSPNLGQVKLKPSAFAELQFNLGQKRAEPEEEEGMGGLGAEEPATEHEP